MKSSLSAHMLLTVLASALALGGCASYQGISSSAQPLVAISLPASPALSSADTNWPQQQWWTAYGDPQLNALIAHALDNSPTLATAQARIAQAQAAAGRANANGAPQVNAAADLSYGRFSENYQIPKPPIGKGGEYAAQGRLAIDFNYDLDLWGRNAALLRAANAQVHAAEFDRDAARLALATSIVRAYAQLAAQYDTQEILQATLKQRGAIRELSRQRVAAGLDTRIELMQTTSNEAALQGDLAQIDTAQAVLRLQLTALSGDMPTSAAGITRPRLSPTPFTVPDNLPLDLLGRRPELAAQRARIAAATGEGEAAKAQFYPNINLSALIGLQSIGLGNLLSPGSLMSSVGPAIRLPIFDAGRLRANYAGKTAEIDLAISQYNQSVVNAAQDVSEQLTRAASLAHEEQAASAALAASEEAYRLAMLRYKGGLSPYLSVLAVEGQLLSGRRAVQDLKLRRQDLQISLIRALGGGFTETPIALAATN
jgi:NodT family efflux transporter outer membrane factor (OMF) lipoprotein